MADRSVAGDTPVVTKITPQAAAVPAPPDPGVVADLSIAIVSWNTRDLLERCLESLLRQSAPDGALSEQRAASAIEALVVDNASTDGSVEMVRGRFPQVCVIVNTGNVGFAAANNQAIRVSSGRYLLLLNPDTEVRPSALETLVVFLDEHLEVGAAGPLLLNPDGSLQLSCYPEPTLSRELWRLFHLDRISSYGRYPVERWSRTAPREVDSLQGACLLVRREVFEQVGLLDEGYFMYSEEIDLCHRIRQAGWKVSWVPQAAVVHYGGQSTRQVVTPMFLRLYQSKTAYFRKHYGRGHARIYKLVLLATSLARLFVAPLAVLEGSHKRRAHLDLANRYLRLVRSLPGF